MSTSKRTISNIVWVAVALLGLAVLQTIFVVRSVETAGNEFEKDLSLRLTQVAQIMDHDAVCFEMFSEETYRSGQDFFLMANKSMGETTKVDTVESYYWKNWGEDTLWSYKKIDFTAPATVQIMLRVNYLDDITVTDSTNLTPLEKVVKKWYQNSLVVKHGNLSFRVVDTILLQETLNTELASLGGKNKFEYVIHDAVASNIVTTSNPELSKTILAKGKWIDLYNDEVFRTPIRLYIYYPNKMGIVMAGFIPLIISFIVLIVALVVVLIFMLRSIMHERRLATLKMNMVNNIAHEFNTPVASISLALDTLKKKKTGGGKMSPEELLDIIEKDNTRLKANIEQILNIKRMEEQTFENAMEKVDMHAVINGLLARFQLTLAAKGGEIHTKLEATHYWVKGNQAQLETAIYNLVDNALKYTIEKAQVRISTDNVNGSLNVEIKDNGIGIDKKDLPFVFDKFYRVNDSNRHDVKGFGLGLHAVQMAVEANGGTITVTSAVDKGTHFHLELPTNEKH